MKLVATETCTDKTHYFLGFSHDPKASDPVPRSPLCLLELIHTPSIAVIANDGKNDQPTGYWKIALAVKDLELARAKLIEQKIQVGEPFQVPDVAYLCHFEDPDGYCIELIQHRFQQYHVAQLPDKGYALDTATTFSLITYRVKDPDKSIYFYQEILGLRLLSKQVVAQRGFTLYFLSCDSEEPPTDNIEDINLREWLWQRPYALIELQHNWGTETDAEFAYDSDISTGFVGLRLLARKHSNHPGSTRIDPIFNCDCVELCDPDGYRIQLLVKD